VRATAGVLLVLMTVGAPVDHVATGEVPTFAVSALPFQAPAPPRTSPWEGLAIVVNQNNPINNLTLWQLREIFLGEKRWWSNHRRITLAAMPRGTAERRTMRRVIYKMNDRDLEKYFFFGLYRGELVTSPTTLETPRDVAAFVARRPGAVGYLRASDVNNSVKVVRVNGLLPGDDGYPLRLRVRPAQ
jgi:ABC-type phosphate transport system substrate-binding protein